MAEPRHAAHSAESSHDAARQPVVPQHHGLESLCDSLEGNRATLEARQQTRLAGADSSDPALSSDPLLAGFDTTLPPHAARFQPRDLIAARFRVVRFLARGGMGEVYEVHDQFLHNTAVALKIIRPEIAAHAGASDRFAQEVLLARKVHHPNLCPIYEIFRCDHPAPPFLFLTMKLLRGQTLQTRLNASPELPRADALEICTQLVRGVAAMHAAGVIHRDLKPNNIMLEQAPTPAHTSREALHNSSPAPHNSSPATYQPSPATHTSSPNAETTADLAPSPHPKLCVVIMDFGLARLHDTELSLAGASLAGTPGYLAPELLEGHHPTEATDLFALGIVLHHILTGTRPFDTQRFLALGPKSAPNPGPATAVPSPILQEVQNLLARDPQTRCEAFRRLQSVLETGHVGPHAAALSTIPAKPATLTRRRFLTTAGATACTLTGLAAWQHNRLYDWLHPLPQKRFVAVLNWPATTDPQVRPMLSGLLDTIATRLSRVEAYDHNFFVTSQRHADLLTSLKDLAEANDALGTNLVLATSVTRLDRNLHIALRVLDPATSHILRARDLHTSLDGVLGLPQRVVAVAADLLSIRRDPSSETRDPVGTSSPEALAAFQQAELLRKKDNDTGLEECIEHYKQALELDPHFAVAQAALAWAYLRSFGLHHQPPALVLGRENSEAAVTLDPDLVEAHTALAWALEQAGDQDRAAQEIKTALALDPENPHTLNYQARLYEDRGEFDKAESTYARVVTLRPNFWLGHFEYGAALEAQGKYAGAVREYQLASLAAPRNALARSNLGSTYLELGQLDEAEQNLRAALALQPIPDAAAYLALLLQVRNDLQQATKYAQQATRLDPDAAIAWLILGDITASTPRGAAAALPAYQRAAVLQQQDIHTRPKAGDGWVLLALCRAKTGDLAGAAQALSTGQGFHPDDLASRVTEVRVLELLGRRTDALALIARCLQQGATPFQFNTLPDLADLRADPRYPQLLRSSASGLASSTSL